MRKLLIVLFAFLVVAPSFATTGKKSKSLLSERQLRKYRAYYMESVCQREAGNQLAQYRLLDRAIRLNPQGAEALYDMAMLVVENSFYDVSETVDAGDYLQRAHDLCPSNDDYTYELACYRFAMCDTSGIGLMRTLLNNPSRRDEAYAALCSFFENSHWEKELYETFEQWRPFRNDDEFISYRKFQAAMSIEDYDNALLIVDTLINNYPASRSGHMVNKGEVLLSLSRYDEAYSIYCEIEEDDEIKNHVQILLFRYANATNNSELMKKALRQMIVNTEMPPQNRVAALRNYFALSSGVDKALVRDSLISELLPLADTDATLYSTLIGQMQDENVADSLIIPLYNKALNINPSDELSRLHLMQYSLQQQQYDELNRLSVDGLKENPSHPLFYYFAGAALQIQKKDSLAIEMFSRGLEFITDQTHTQLVSSYYSAYADALHKVGRKQEAYEMYDSALVYNNENIMCLNNYAYFLSLDNKDLDKAEKMSLKTLEDQPDEPTYLDTYAWIKFLKGDYEEARRYQDKAIENSEDIDDDPDNVSLLEHAGDIYYHLGLTDEALKFWQRALKLGEGSGLLKKKVQLKKYINPNQSLE